MKHVFVETNFLIEASRPCPKKPAQRLLERSGKDVTLWIPWCAITEARRTIQRVVDDDLGFETAMLTFAVHEGLPQHPPQDHAVLQRFAKRVRATRRVTKGTVDARIDEIVTRMQVIPPSPEAVTETLRMWQVKLLHPFDEMILGSVLTKATELHRQGERELYFCNLNKSDFSPLDRGGNGVTRPNLAAEYARCGVTYLDSFEVPVSISSSSPTRIRDMSKAADRLRERLSELECLPPDPWSAIEAWAERTRPLIAHFYPSLLDQFNQCTKAPPYPPYFHISARPTRWEDAYDYERRRDAERRNAESKARAAARYQQLLSEARQKLISLIVGMLDLEDLPPSPANQASTNVVFAQFDRSNVAIAGLSAGSNFTASATLSHSSSITEPQLKVAVKDLQRSLIDVQDQLNDIDERLCEYLSQILLNIRKLQFEQADLATVLGLVKESVDDLWAKDAWNAIKPQLLPKLAKAAEILIGATGHPLAQDIARGIAG